MKIHKYNHNVIDLKIIIKKTKQSNKIFKNKT